MNSVLSLHILKWIALAILVALFAGSASALFLHLLDWATHTREAYPWIVLGLPVAGFLVALVYLKLGKSVEAGNNLLIDEIHDAKQIIPLRMAPLILGGTVISHLFGASVGREGTAVQMGGALSDQLSRLFKLHGDDRKIILMTGIAAGFASVFGTPLAGMIFAMEVLAIGKMRYEALLPCLVAAVVADQTGLFWGVHHTQYMINYIPELSLPILIPIAIAGILFGLVGRGFAVSIHHLSARMKEWIPMPLMRPVIGGSILAFLFLRLDASRYMGLGIPVIQESFLIPLSWQDAAGKFIFTVASIGSGFKGGEVTPLFYIGSTFGNAIAPLLHMPYSLMAGLGFVAVFAGAANTPIACTIMAMELFGGEVGIYAAVACIFAYIVSGHSGIYKAQRVGSRKQPNTKSPD